MLSENEVVLLNLEDIIPNRFQPREVFDEKALNELAASIKEHGIIQPIIVRNIGEKYEIIAGERRYKASAIAGLTKIPAIVKNLDDKESSKVALLENLQRKDLTSIEEARTYQKILELDELTQEELAKTMGKSQPAIANKIRLLSLSEEVQDALLKEKISERHARSLLNVKNKEDQILLLNKIINNRMTVKELEEELKPQLISEDVNTLIPAFNHEDVVSNIPTNSNEEMGLDSLLAKIQKEIDEEDAKIQQLDSGSTNISVGETEENSKKGLDFLLGNNIESLEPSVESLENTDIFDREVKEKPIFDTLVGINNDNDSNHPPFSPIELTPLTEELQPEPAIEPQIIEETLENTRPTLINAITEVREKVKNLEEKGFSVNVEEMDFEDTYQIIIKVNKNK